MGDILNHNEANDEEQGNKSDKYTTKTGKEIPYQLAINWEECLDTGKPEVQREGDRGTNPAIRGLKKGEYAAVEIKYSLDKNFVFNGSNKIDSYQDVAYLFKKLETSAVENVFVVYVKNQRPIIQHMSMGSNVASLVWVNAITDGVSRFKPDSIYFIHNHPGGSLNPSSADVQVYKTLKNSFPKLMQEGIIIDIDSGYFSIFADKNPTIIKNEEKISNPVNYRVLKFDRAVFNKDVKKEKVSTSMDVASLVASQRLSNGDKLSILILSRSNNVMANLHLPYSNFNHENLLNDVCSYSARFGGTGVLFYGRFKDEIVKKQTDALKTHLIKHDITLVDILNIKSSPEIFVSKDITNNDYKSIADEGLLEPQYRYAVVKAEELYNKQNPQVNKIPSVSSIKENKINRLSI